MSGRWSSLTSTSTFGLGGSASARSGGRAGRAARAANAMAPIRSMVWLPSEELARDDDGLMAVA